MQIIARTSLSKGISNKGRYRSIQPNNYNKIKAHITSRNTHIVQSFQLGVSDTSLQELLIEQSYIVGHFIGYFVLFTALFNWIYYRDINNKNDEDN